MTGYGRGECIRSQVSAEAEFRTVNGKTLSLKCRLPGHLLELEPTVEAILRKGLSRGSLQGFIRVRSLRSRPAATDSALLRAYLRQWRRLEKELGLESRKPTLPDLLAMPGALEQTPESPAERRASLTAAKVATRQALASLLESRQQEGVCLSKDLLRLHKKLLGLLARVCKRLPEARSAQESRLQSRVTQAWQAAGVDDSLDLTRELVVLAERADVQEECSRLEIHLARFAGLVRGGGSIGRELEFLCQEIHREITTLGNKSADEPLSALVVQMKLVAGQLKEQIANVE